MTPADRWFTYKINWTLQPQKQLNASMQYFLTGKDKNMLTYNMYLFQIYDTYLSVLLIYWLKKV